MEWIGGAAEHGFDKSASLLFGSTSDEDRLCDGVCSNSIDFFERIEDGELGLIRTYK